MRWVAGERRVGPWLSLAVFAVRVALGLAWETQYGGWDGRVRRLMAVQVIVASGLWCDSIELD